MCLDALGSCCRCFAGGQEATQKRRTKEENKVKKSRKKKHEEKTKSLASDFPKLLYVPVSAASLAASPSPLLPPIVSLAGEIPRPSPSPPSA